MALALQPAQAKMALVNYGVKTQIQTGEHSVLLHNNVNFLDFAVDQQQPPSPVTNGPALRFKGQVFFTGDPGDRAEVDRWVYGFIQVARLWNYRFRYAGRVKGEGSIDIDLNPQFTPNPCLDGESTEGRADISISVSQKPVVTAVATPVKGFRVDVTCVDNPTSIVPNTFDHPRSGAKNYLFEARRDESFLTCLAARAPDGTLHLLATCRWKLTWHGQFRWKSGSPKAELIDKSSPAVFAPVVTGDPGAGDELVAMARNPNGKWANELDRNAWLKALAKDGNVFKWSGDMPPDLPPDFYT